MSNKNNRIILDADGNIVSVNPSAPSEIQSNSAVQRNSSRTHTVYRTPYTPATSEVQTDSDVPEENHHWMQTATKYFFILLLLVIIGVVWWSEATKTTSDSTVSDSVVSGSSVSDSVISDTTVLDENTTTTTTAATTTTTKATTSVANKSTSGKSKVTSMVPVSEDALDFLAGVIFFEQGDYSIEGQIAVGHVILNRLEKEYTEDRLLFELTDADQFATVNEDPTTWEYRKIYSQHLQSISYKENTFYTKKSTSQSLKIALALLNGETENPIGNRDSFRSKEYFLKHENDYFLDVTDEITIGDNTFFTYK